jgi:hypothetical protein
LAIGVVPNRQGISLADAPGAIRISESDATAIAAINERATR